VTRVSHGLDRVGVDFDDESLVANAGLILIATMAARLDLEVLIDATVRLNTRLERGQLSGRPAGNPSQEAVGVGPLVLEGSSTENPQRSATCPPSHHRGRRGPARVQRPSPFHRSVHPTELDTLADLNERILRHLAEDPFPEHSGPDG
jgi:hypothetical protein